MHTDHKPRLTPLKAKPTLNQFRRRRLQFLSQFEMQVKHIAAVHNEIADYLSCVLLKNDPEVLQVNEVLMSDTRLSTLLQQFTSKLTPIFNQEFRERLLQAQKQKSNVILTSYIFHKPSQLYHWQNPKG